MPSIALEDCLSMGENGYPPTLPDTGLSSKTRVNGKYVVLKDQTIYADHGKSGSPTHAGALRMVTNGSSKAKIEGKNIARIGDSIADGDMINQGFDKVNVGG